MCSNYILILDNKTGFAKKSPLEFFFLNSLHSYKYTLTAIRTQVNYFNQSASLGVPIRIKSDPITMSERIPITLSSRVLFASILHPTYTKWQSQPRHLPVSEKGFPLTSTRRTPFTRAHDITSRRLTFEWFQGPSSYISSVFVIFIITIFAQA